MHDEYWPLIEGHSFLGHACLKKTKCIILHIFIQTSKDVSSMAIKLNKLFYTIPIIVKFINTTLFYYISLQTAGSYKN